MDAIKIHYQMRDLQAENDRLRAEIENLRAAYNSVLTNAEQKLLLRLSQGYGDDPPGAITNRALSERDRATLRGLLERGGRK